jgi:hypothetical protein
MGKTPKKSPVTEPEPQDIGSDEEEVVAEEPTFTKADIDEAIDEAFDTHGYMSTIKERQVRDWYAVVQALYKPVSKSIANSLDERPTAVTTRGTLMDTAFAFLPGPNDWHDEADPVFAEAVWKALDSKVWAQTDTGRDKPLQRMVGANTPDLILCRTKVAIPPSKDIVDAVYITGDRDCLMTDFYGAREKRLLKLAETLGANLSMVMTRQPDHANFFDRKFKRTMKLALVKGQSEMLPALEAAQGDDDEDDADA